MDRGRCDKSPPLARMLSAAARAELVGRRDERKLLAILLWIIRLRA